MLVMKMLDEGVVIVISIVCVQIGKMVSEFDSDGWFTLPYVQVVTQSTPGDIQPVVVVTVPWMHSYNAISNFQQFLSTFASTRSTATSTMFFCMFSWHYLIR